MSEPSLLERGSVEDRFKAILDLLQEAVLVVEASGRIVEANPAAVSLFGWVREDLRDRLVVSLFAEGTQAAEVLSRARSGGFLHGMEVGLAVRSLEICTASVTGSVVPGPPGAGAWAVLLFRKPLSTPQAGPAQARAEQLSQRMFEEGLVAMAMLDLRGRFLEVNPALGVLTGFSQDSLLPLGLAELFVDEERAAVAERVRSIESSAPESVHSAHRLVCADAEERWVRLSLSRIEGMGSVASEVLCVFHDIDLGKRTEMLRHEFIEGVVRAQEEERRRVSRELHDGVGQLLTGLTVRLATLGESLVEPAARKQVEDLQVLAEAATEETRQMAHRLRPAAVDGPGFVAAMGNLVADHERIHGVEAAFHARGLVVGGLSVVQETALYRIAQEALANSARHAGAKRVEVLVDRSEANVRLIVEDDGTGFGSEEEHGGLGLRSIHERAALLGGVAVVESSPGAGTSVYVDLPLQEPG